MESTIDCDSDFDFDPETSSDDEYNNYDGVYNLYKNGREYIYFFSKDLMLVPSLEFEKVYGKKMDILRNKCKNVTIDNNGIKSYKFIFPIHLTNSNGIVWEPKCEYIYNDMELDKIARKIRDMMEQYSDNVPWRSGCEKKDKKWYSESKHISFNENNQESQCTIKERFEFYDDYPPNNRNAYNKKIYLDKRKLKEPEKEDK